MITKDNIRAIYKLDAKTKDGILYFYPKKVDRGETLMWVCERDEEIKYFFDVPFLDDNWEIQQKLNLQTADGEDIYEKDTVHLRYEANEFHDIDEGDFIFYLDKDLNLCLHDLSFGESDEFDMYWSDFSMHPKLKIIWKLLNQ
jgi:hypothetical protein